MTWASDRFIDKTGRRLHVDGGWFRGTVCIFEPGANDTVLTILELSPTFARRVAEMLVDAADYIDDECMEDDDE